MRPVTPKIAMRLMVDKVLVDRAGEEFLDALEEGPFAGLVAALAQRGLEFPQQFFLLRVETDGSLHHHAAEQIPGRTAALRANAFFAHAKHPPGLSLARDPEHHVAAERRHLHRAAE